MKEQLLRVRRHSNKTTLILPNFFERAPLKDIRKIMNWLKLWPEQNEGVREKLDTFFPAWKADLEDCLNRDEAEREEAEQNHAAYGPMPKLWRSMTGLERGLTNRLKLATEATKHARNNLERCDEVLSAYKAVKERLI
jgi:hypothetical protein